MPSALLQSTSHQNARVVPVSPKVKSAKTCKLFNTGAVKLAGSAKSVDPIVYNARVGWETSATGCLKPWRMTMSYPTQTIRERYRAGTMPYTACAAYLMEHYGWSRELAHDYLVQSQLQDQFEDVED